MIYRGSLFQHPFYALWQNDLIKTWTFKNGLIHTWWWSVCARLFSCGSIPITPHPEPAEKRGVGSYLPLLQGSYLLLFRGPYFPQFFVFRGPYLPQYSRFCLQGTISPPIKLDSGCHISPKIDFMTLFTKPLQNQTTIGLNHNADAY